MMNEQHCSTGEWIHTKAARMNGLKALLASLLFPAVLFSSAHALEEATVVFHTRKNGNDVIAFDIRAKAVHVVWSGRGIRSTRFGPHGKTVIIHAGQKLVVANIDGSGATEYQPEHWPPDVRDPGQKWDYAQGGAYWPMSNGNFYRFDPETGKTTRITISGGSLGTRMSISADGRRGYSGRRVFITLSADHNSASLWDSGSKGCLSGHGNSISGGGRYVGWSSFSSSYDGGCGSHNLGVVEFTDELVSGSASSSCDYPNVWCVMLDEVWKGDPNLPEPNGNIANWAGPRQVVNSDDWFIYVAGAHFNDEQHKRWALVNIHTKEAVKVPIVKNVTYNDDLAYGEAWVGPLPRQSGTRIVADKNELVFTASDTDGHPTISQDVRVTHIGASLPGTISATAGPAADWLSITVNSSNTDTVVLRNVVDPSRVGAGMHTTTVTVKGSEAVNEKQYTVTFAKGILPAPSGISSTTMGDAESDVAISWTDNASDEEGFAVERKPGDGVWTEIDRVAADVVSYTDSALSAGAYVYRVRAYRADRFSPYSQETKITITGTPWVAITAPAAGSCLPSGEAATIAWETHLVGDVQLLASEDGGRTYEDLSNGSIDAKSSEWSNFSWDLSGYEQGTMLTLKLKQYGNDDIADVVRDLMVSDEGCQSTTVATASPGETAPRVVVSRGAAGGYTLRITGSAAYVARLYDMRGMEIGRWDGRNEEPFLLSGIGRGTYVLHVQQSIGRMVSPIVIR